MCICNNEKNNNTPERVIGGKQNIMLVTHQMADELNVTSRRVTTEFTAVWALIAATEKEPARLESMKNALAVKHPGTPTHTLCMAAERERVSDYARNLDLYCLVYFGALCRS